MKKGRTQLIHIGNGCSESHNEDIVYQLVVERT